MQICFDPILVANFNHEDVCDLLILDRHHYQTSEIVQFFWFFL